jgi:hypothetical protein
MPDMKRLCDDPGRTTSGTTQFQTPPQDCLDLFKIHFHGLHTSKGIFTQRRKDRKGAPEPFDPPLRLCDLCAFA